MSPQIFAIAAAAALLWYVGDKTVHFVKKVDHAIVKKLNHPKPPPILKP